MTPRLRTGLIVAALSRRSPPSSSSARPLSAEELPPPAGSQAQPSRSRERRRSCSISGSAPTPRRATCGAPRALRRRAGARGGARSSRAALARGEASGRVRRLAGGSLERLEQLGGSIPRSALAQLHLGLARLWAAAGGCRDGVARGARRASRTRATRCAPADLLHPEFAPRPARLRARGALPAGVASCRRRASSSACATAPSPRPKGRAGRLLYGSRSSGSAGRVSARARLRGGGAARARRARGAGRRRGRPLRQGRPAAAFSRLGPLTRRFPQAATVRFHLGLLLLWTGRSTRRSGSCGSRERAAARLAPRREARRYLRELEEAGTG